LSAHGAAEYGLSINQHQKLLASATYSATEAMNLKTATCNPTITKATYHTQKESTMEIVSMKRIYWAEVVSVQCITVIAQKYQ
jgi:hypothetical protein